MGGHQDDPAGVAAADVMTLFERWALIHTERTEAERLAEIERNRSGKNAKMNSPARRMCSMRWGSGLQIAQI